MAVWILLSSNRNVKLVQLVGSFVGLGLTSGGTCLDDIPNLRRPTHSPSSTMSVLFQIIPYGSIDFRLWRNKSYSYIQKRRISNVISAPRPQGLAPTKLSFETAWWGCRTKVSTLSQVLCQYIVTFQSHQSHTWPKSRKNQMWGLWWSIPNSQVLSQASSHLYPGIFWPRNQHPNILKLTGGGKDTFNLISFKELGG